MAVPQTSSFEVAEKSQGRDLRLAELLGALSYALDITEGQPEGHCIRVCWIGMHVGRRIGLPDNRLWELYYTLLLKDLGCSSNAARICELYLADDLGFKRDFKRVPRGLAPALKFVFTHTGLKAKFTARVRAIVGILKDGGDIARDLIETRCTRGAEIARKLRFSESVAHGVHDLDEHWDGQGRPEGRKGEEIALYARIALLAQVVDVFHAGGGRAEAVREIQQRRGTWFDPTLVDAFCAEAQDDAFWRGLTDPELATAILDLEPARHVTPVSEDYLDDIAEAFGQVIDAKSPYTSGHSDRVALYADAVAEALGVTAERRRWLKRAARLHDVGKLGVSNTILDKPGRLDSDEWVAVQAHAAYTHAILGRIAVFEDLAAVSAAHHERLDGRGYPLGLQAHQITLETRIISVADFFDALTAERPYRRAMPFDQALHVMRESLDVAIDREVFEALERVIALRPDLCP